MKSTKEASYNNGVYKIRIKEKSCSLRGDYCIETAHNIIYTMDELERDKKDDYSRYWNQIFVGNKEECEKIKSKFVEIGYIDCTK